MRYINGLGQYSLLLASTACIMLSATKSVNADPAVFFDTIPDGRAEFEMRVNDAGGTFTTDALSGLVSNTNSWARTGYTITSSNGANRIVSNAVLNPAPLGNPGGDGISMNADGSVTSGLTYTFNTAINGFGLDLEDWATCCFPSSLYIAFDGGAPILIGTATQNSDNPGAAAGQGDTTFIGAIDDSGTFTTVTFYGTGAGDALYGGGIIYYAVVPLGALSGTIASYTDDGGTTKGGYLDQNLPDGVRTSIITALNGASDAEAQKVIKRIYPVGQSTVAQAGMSAGLQAVNTTFEKVGTVLGRSASLSTANTVLGLSQREFEADGLYLPSFGVSEDNTFGDLMLQLSSTPYQKFDLGAQAVWIEGIGTFAYGDETSLSNSYHTLGAGLVGGYEHALKDDLMLGLMFSGYTARIDFGNQAGDTQADLYTLGVYGQKLLGHTKLTGLLSAGYGEYQADRNIVVGNVVNEQATGEYNSWSGNASVGASRLYETDKGSIEPFLKGNFSYIMTEDFTETGAGSFNMQVDENHQSSVGVNAGVTWLVDREVNDKNVKLSLTPYAGYQWEIEGGDSDVSLASASTGTTVEGRELTTFQLGLNAQMDIDLENGRDFKFGVNAGRDKYEERVALYVGFGMAF